MKHKNRYAALFIFVWIVCLIIKIGLGFLFFGLCILCFGIYGIRGYRKIKLAGIRCSGVVTGYQVDKDGDRTPVVAFVTSQGEEISNTPFVYGRTDLQQLFPGDLTGQPIEVLYDPDKPSRFLLVNNSGVDMLFMVLLMIFSLVFIGVGSAALLGYIHF